MGTVDIAILVAYLVAMVLVGVYCSRKSAASMKAAYKLGADMAYRKFYA